MNEGNKVKLLAVGLVVFLLGMGSSWFVLRNPSPEPVVIVDRSPGEKEKRYVPPVDKKKPDRRKVNVRPAKPNEKEHRKGYEPRKRIGQKRGTGREGSRKKSDSMRQSC
jgi:hypothetical protein